MNAYIILDGDSSSSALPVLPTGGRQTVLQNLRSLSNLTGVITSPAALEDYNRMVAPSNLPRAAHSYMEAHGYDSDAKLHLLHALNTYNDVDEFCDYLCARGMARAEADWLFKYIQIFE